MTQISTQIPRLYRRVADQLIEAIRNGEYKPGDKIPPERELADKFSVSRPTVREAMIALEIYGVVEIRHGSGIYVLEGVNEALKAGEASFTLREDLDVGPFELIEARLIVEGATAAIAAASRTQADLEILEDCVRRMDGTDYEKIEVADHEFHTQIAMATNNGPLIDIVENLWSLRNNSMLASKIMTIARGGGGAARVDEHGEILAALRAQNPVAARQAMVAHLEKVRDYLLDVTESEEIEALLNKHEANRALMTNRIKF